MDGDGDKYILKGLIRIPRERYPTRHICGEQSPVKIHSPVCVCLALSQELVFDAGWSCYDLAGLILPTSGRSVFYENGQLRLIIFGHSSQLTANKSNKKDKSIKHSSPS